jgi:hypothetical protein
MALLLASLASAYSRQWGMQGRLLCAPDKVAYISVMESLLTFLIPLAMLATLIVLGFGIVQMIRGGNPRRSNKLMQYRVVLQGLALLLFAVLMMMFKR